MNNRLIRDRKVLPKMNTMNAMYKLAEETIKGNFDVADNDETMVAFYRDVVGYSSE